MDEFESGYIKRALEDLHADFREFKELDRAWKVKAEGDLGELRNLVVAEIAEKQQTQHTWTTIAKGSKFLLAAVAAIAMLKFGDASGFFKELIKLLTL